MQCKNCGAPLETDAVFCANCGTRVERETVQPEAAPVAAQEPVREAAPAASAGKKFKMSFNKIIGLIVGTVLIVIGLVEVLSAGSSISSASFGGDFYTYTYRGIVAISKQLASIQAGLGWVVVAIGAAVDVRALRD